MRLVPVRLIPVRPELTGRPLLRLGLIRTLLFRCLKLRSSEEALQNARRTQIEVIRREDIRFAGGRSQQNLSFWQQLINDPVFVHCVIVGLTLRTSIHVSRSGSR